MRYPSVETIAKGLAIDLDQARRIRGLIDGTGATRCYLSVHEFEKRSLSPSRRLDRVMIALNAELYGFGDEPIRASDYWHSYFGDIVAIYINNGDTYGVTMLYDIRRDSWYVTSYGD